MPSKPQKKRGRGRPEHKPTPVTRRKVSAGAGGGMYHDEIAAALGISRDTLTKHYGQELGRVAFQKRLDVLDAHYRSAMKGNVSAQKSYLARAPHNPVPEPNRDGTEAPAAGMLLGKKDQANQDAKGAEVGTSWEHLLGRNGQPN